MSISSKHAFVKFFNKKENDPDTYGELIFDKGGKDIKWKKESLHKWCWENWTVACKSIKLETHPHIMHKK